MHIYFHIGIGKTGTSSIQSTLYHNRVALKSQGILYPETGLADLGHGVAHFGLCSIGQDGIEEELRSTFERLRLELQSSGAHTAVLSSENFTYATLNFTSSLKRLFESDEITVIIYARPQAPLIESTYLWWQKEGLPYDDSIDLFFEKHKKSFNYLTRVESWASVFGSKNILCRVYDRRIIGTDVTTDFCSTIGAGSLSNENFSRENPSLPARFSSLVTELDKLNPNPTTRSKFINEFVSISSHLKGNSKESLLTSKLKEAIGSYYQESNIEFAHRYLSPTDAAVFLDSN